MDRNETFTIQALYDAIRIINHSPLVYEVRNNNQVGLVRADGSVLAPTEFTRFGGTGNVRDNTRDVLVIEDVQNGQPGIVAVLDNRRVGIVNLITGQGIGTFEISNIHARVSQATDEIQYFVESGTDIAELERYLEHFFR